MKNITMDQNRKRKNREKTKRFHKVKNFADLTQILRNDVFANFHDYF